jgi:hypothetical protein
LDLQRAVEGDQMRLKVLVVFVCVLIVGCGSSAPIKTTIKTIAPEPDPTHGMTIQTTSAREQEEEFTAEEKEKRIKAQAEKKAKEKKIKEENELGNRYPPQVQQNFLVSCAAQESSKSSCHCLLRKVEARDSLGELIALEQALKAGIPLPHGVQEDAEACREI